MVSRLPKLNVWAFSGASLITWTIGIVLLGVISLFGWATPLVSSISSLYIGYSVTLVGIFIGALWAALDGFVFGLIFALTYNCVLTWCPLIRK